MAESCPPPPYESIAHPNPTSEYGYKQTPSEQLQPPTYEDDARLASVTSTSYRMMLQPLAGSVDIRTRDGDTLSSEQQQPPAYEDDARLDSVTSISYPMMLQPPPGYVAIRNYSMGNNKRMRNKKKNQQAVRRRSHSHETQNPEEIELAPRPSSAQQHADLRQVSGRQEYPSGSRNLRHDRERQGQDPRQGGNPVEPTAPDQQDEETGRLKRQIRENDQKIREKYQKIREQISQLRQQLADRRVSYFDVDFWGFNVVEF